MWSSRGASRWKPKWNSNAELAWSSGGTRIPWSSNAELTRSSNTAELECRAHVELMRSSNAEPMR
eukprot:2561145-Alexandrium_andersonii.AAC.1